MNFFARLATPLYPIMDNMFLESFFFFIPYRLVWDNWERFCGAQDNPSDSISYTVPVLTGTSASTGEGTLWDYFGLPLDDGTGTSHVDPDNLSTSCLPFRAYGLIFDEWFRDQNLQDAYYIDRSDRGDDGPDSMSSGSTGTGTVRSHPLKRGKRHDYFTSCLPSPQKGSAAALPITGTPYVHGDATALGVAYSVYNDRTAGYTQLGSSGS